MGIQRRGVAATVAALALGLLVAPSSALAAPVGKIAYQGADLAKSPILSFGWSVTRPHTLTGGGGGGGDAAFTHIEFTKDVSRATPAELVHAARGLTIPAAVITFEDSPLEVCVTDAVVTELTEESRAGKLVESVSLGYRRILLTFDIGLVEIPMGGFDLAGNAEWTGPCP